MTTLNAVPAEPAISVTPEATTARLCLRLLTDEGSPLPNGGKLRTTTVGFQTVEDVANNAVHFQGALVSDLGDNPKVSFVLESPSGDRILEISLAVLDFGDSLEDRIEVEVVAMGISPEYAASISMAPDGHTWRLVSHAAQQDDMLHLTFDLVQEVEATESIDAQASCRLSFGDNDDPQRATIKPKRSGVGPVPVS